MILHDLIRASLASSTLAPITVEGLPPKRSQINLLIFARYGTGKTTLLDKIAQYGLGLKMKRWTTASVVGSITRGGQIIPPVLMEAAGKTILVDEFQAIPSSVRTDLLTLMEEQQTYRALSFRVPERVVLDSEHWKVWAVEGYLWFKIKASYIVATASLLGSEHDKMLMSRCIQLNVAMDYEDVVHGGFQLDKLRLDDIQQIRARLSNKSIRYTRQQYDDVLNYIVEELKENEIPAQYSFRVADEIIRLDNLHQLGVLNDEPLKYLRIILLGIKGAKITTLQHRILRMLMKGDFNTYEIAKEIGLKDEYVLALLHNLESMKLVKFNDRWRLIWKL